MLSDSLNLTQGGEEFDLSFNTQVICINNKDLQQQFGELVSFDKDVAELTPNEYGSDEEGQIWLSQPVTTSIFFHQILKRAPCQPWKDNLTKSIHQLNYFFEKRCNARTIYLDQLYDPPIPSKYIGFEC